MALRVLLADESSTIKKVFQLALQDFAVEVRSVNIGLDVASVSGSFKPDIIFADVLLQKKNGYDVCSELKGNDALKSVPVVLMWSGFMELDEDKFQASQANAQLEKPFDVATLRKLITDLVPRTHNQKLSQFLTFPHTPAEAGPPAAAAAKVPTPIEDEEDFLQVSIPKMKVGSEKYRLDLKPEELDPQHIAVDFDDSPAAKISAAVLEKSSGESEDDDFKVYGAGKRTLSAPRDPGPESLTLDDEDADELKSDEVTHMATPAARAPAGDRTGPPPTGLSSEQLEEIIRQQSHEVIESVVWKVVPELAKQIIERELNKLLKERDSHPY